MVFQFLGVEPQSVENPLAEVSLLPIPYDFTTSYRPGARFGPTAILNASLQVELFDEELAWDASQCLEFKVEPEVAANANSPESMMNDVREAALRILRQDRFLFSLGGEHSLSAPLIAAHKEKYPDLHVIQIDAHGDLRENFNGTGHSHASVMRRVVDMDIPLTQIGLRNISEEEYSFLRENPQLPIHQWKAVNLRNSQGWSNLLEYLNTSIKGPIYLTIDVDGLDPSVIPATGTPEPGGLGWWDILEILKAVCRNNRVIGADLMELAPHPGLEYANFAAAKLCYKILTYVFYPKWNDDEQ